MTPYGCGFDQIYSYTYSVFAELQTCHRYQYRRSDLLSKIWMDQSSISLDDKYYYFS